MLQIRIVTMLAARDKGVNTCNLRKLGELGDSKTVTGVGSNLTRVR